MYYRGSSCLLFRLGGPRTPIWRSVVSAPGPSSSRPTAKAAVRHSSQSSSVDPARYLVLRRRSGLVVLCSLLATALPRDGGATLCAGAARANSGRRGPEGEDDEEAAETALRKALDAALGPMGGEITLGCLVGFTSGYALKKVRTDGLPECGVRPSHWCYVCLYACRLAPRPSPLCRSTSSRLPYIHVVHIYAMQVGKAAAFFIGMAYVTGSTLQALGYVDVTWKKVIMGSLSGDTGYVFLTETPQGKWNASACPISFFRFLFIHSSGSWSGR